LLLLLDLLLHRQSCANGLNQGLLVNKCSASSWLHLSRQGCLLLLLLLLS
jgi:hypothetical protein